MEHFSMAQWHDESHISDRSRAQILSLPFCAFKLSCRLISISPREQKKSKIAFSFGSKVSAEKYTYWGSDEFEGYFCIINDIVYKINVPARLIRAMLKVTFSFLTLSEFVVRLSIFTEMKELVKEKNP